MSLTTNSARAAKPQAESRDYFWLMGTLRNYEVTELSGHELGRILPQVIMAARRRTESEPVDPESRES
jgi:hypothetical protein